ncbi:hypothetical protein TD95_002676 [Thielaviopsis punctulata]|uniref:Uncharacterized protein n=1 Tax=Thielaviopsis punctulata TaxID=72032 RepID=A0A0F4ZFQ9_9PEZI|nr:hypothetical protein TD95_002676 [Thielaviopsis punctulata]
MWIFPLVGYLGSALAFVFLTVAIATGLYYLSELIEEHTVTTKRIITRLIYFIIGLQTTLLIVDGFPFFQSLLTIVSHGVYYGNLRRFPWVSMTDPVFISSIVLVLLNHFFWFRHFSGLQQSFFLKQASSGGSMYDRPDLPTFPQVAAFFGINVWLVPFSLFISLSANDHVLPTMASASASASSASASSAADGGGLGVPAGMAPGKRPGFFKAIIDGVGDRVAQVASMGGGKRRWAHDL